MYWNFEQIYGLFAGANSNLLLGGKWGIERETQRVTPNGALALTDHPVALGNKLENPNVTTDFSESQLELITQPFDSVEETYKSLKEIHSKVDKVLEDEFLWPLSMPPKLPVEEVIPIAKFDGSKEGVEKEIYRAGLATRYGKKMQMISGIHFNFSFGSKMVDLLYHYFGNGMEKRLFIDTVYLALTRNFLRYRWLLIYLFGASPSVDTTYHSVIYKELKTIAKCCPECCNPIGSLEKKATSLRASRFGYSNSVQGKYSVSFNSLEDYILGIRKLLKTKSKRFSRLGIYKDGRQIQLNDNILQKESEFYSSIRLKQVTGKGESQLEALGNRGVRYAEVRILDVNPFERVGISLNQLYFLQVFMLFCLFEESGFMNEMEMQIADKNHHLVALSGRKKNLMLVHNENGTVSLNEWGKEIFRKLSLIAALIDQNDEGTKYQDCIKKEYKKLQDMSLLPSAIIQKEMEEKEEDFLEFGIRKTQEYKNEAKPIQVVFNTVKSREMAQI